MLSVTEIQQKWGKIAEKVAGDMYKGLLLSEFCSKSEKAPGDEKTCTDHPRIALSEETKKSILNSFLGGS